MNKPRIRAVLQAALALAGAPDGFTVGQFADRVRSILAMPATDYDSRRAAYDQKNLRAKALVTPVPHARRYRVPLQAVRTIGALVILREHGVRPLLWAAIRMSTRGPRMTVPSVILDEAFLSFLGLGVPPPEASWGVLVEQGVAAMSVRPLLLVSPAVLMAVTIIMLNVLADPLRDTPGPTAMGR